MPLSEHLRMQLLAGFRAEVDEYRQSLIDGLLALEQQRVAADQRQIALEDLFRAAHSVKGAARALGMAATEHLAHGLEDVLASLQQGLVEQSPELFTACYRVLDAIQVMQGVDEVSDLAQAEQALLDLAPFRLRGSTRLAPASDEFSAELHAGNGNGKLAPALAAPDEFIVELHAAVAGNGNGNGNGNGKPTSKPALASTAPASPAVLESTPAGETIRVSAAKLDALMAQLSELLLTKMRAEQRLAQVRQAQDFMAVWQKEWLAVRGLHGRMTRHGYSASQGAQHEHSAYSKDTTRLLAYLGTSQERLRAMHAQVNLLARETANDTMHMTLVIDALEQEIKRVRVLPLATITSPFARMVRDLALAASKDVHFALVGAEVELDKRVLEQVKDPLIHLLRNALDHGIESAEARAVQGKPRQGRITLSAEQRGKDVILSVSDDGMGIDYEGVRRSVTRRGIDGQALSQQELEEWIFTSGVTSSAFITDVSGRGVGLDVVRRNVEALRGRVTVLSTPGQGTTFTLTLPLTLTSSRGLLVRAGGNLFAIPLSAIERILRVGREDVHMLEGRSALRYNGRPLTLVRLADVLELPVPQNESVQGDGRLQVIILASAERRMAFVVEELAGEQEIVIKGLGKQLARVGGIAGASVLGNGEVVLILNVADMLKLALRGGHHTALAQPEANTAVATTRRRQRILIADDSITTRTLEKNILETAGYLVQLATDGQEALGALAGGTLPDLIVSDVDMPRVNGIELTRRVKGDARTAHLPIILVTSLDAPADKMRGMEAGADAYIVKGRFDQNNLLETIEQLL